MHDFIWVAFLYRMLYGFQETEQALLMLNFTDSFFALPEDFHVEVPATPFEHPKLVAFNAEAAQRLGLPEGIAREPDFIRWFTGEKRLPGAGAPRSSVYAGHQFGHYVPQLGDGRAHLLGEITTVAGERWEIQLKGSGRTPFSRFGDGRAVLRSAIREYLCSEAMDALGIPTTRALCIIGSDEPVQRETVERAAILTRLAPSHLRFGHFEYFFHQGEDAQVRELADYAITTFFPEIAQGDHTGWFHEIVRRTARLIAQWQAVGFMHGVMNTDNMSILGLTIDYGPYGFMEAFDPGHICNHSDEFGRYAFNQQPAIGQWNLMAFATALSHLLPEDAIETGMRLYATSFNEHYTALMQAKCGFATRHEADHPLITDWLTLLYENRMDYSLAFRALGDVRRSDPGHTPPLLAEMAQDREKLQHWLIRYRARLLKEDQDDDTRQAAMRQLNPLYLLRNHLAQHAIEQAENGEFDEIDRLLAILRHPCDERDYVDARYAKPAPAGMAEVCVSCSS